MQKAIKGDLADDPFDSLLAKTHFWLDIAEVLVLFKYLNLHCHSHICGRQRPLT